MLVKIKSLVYNFFQVLAHLFPVFSIFGHLAQDLNPLGSRIIFVYEVSSDPILNYLIVAPTVRSHQRNTVPPALRNFYFRFTIIKLIPL